MKKYYECCKCRKYFKDSEMNEVVLKNGYSTRQMCKSCIDAYNKPKEIKEQIKDVKAGKSIDKTKDLVIH